MKFFTLSLLAIGLSVWVSADEFDDLFSDDAFADVDVESTDVEPSVLSLAHELSLQSIVNVNSEKANDVEELYSGVTSARARYQPSFIYEPSETVSVYGAFALSTDGIFWVRSNDEWSDADIDARQFQFETKELVAQYRVNDWQLNSGIQTVTLGLADALSVSNILYAQNLSVPGTTDLDDTQKAAWTTVASGSLGDVRIKAGSVHTHELNTVPPAGTDFDTGLTTLLDAADLSLQEESLAIQNMGYFVSLSGVLGPLDWQVNAVSQLPHTPSLEVGLVGMSVMPVAVHTQRENTASLASSYVMGSFLWKLEGAFTQGLSAQAASGMMPGEMIDYQRVGGTAGFDFNHNTLGRLVAEIQYSQILDYDSMNFLQTDEKTVQWVLMYSKMLLRDRLSIMGQMIGFDIDAGGGRMQVVSAEYDVTDALNIGARYVDYVDGDFQFLSGADDRDRLVATVNYSF